MTSERLSQIQALPEEAAKTLALYARRGVFSLESATPLKDMLHACRNALLDLLAEHRGDQ